VGGRNDKRIAIGECVFRMRYYRRDRRVQSVMIEINRRLYIDGEGHIKSGYERVKGHIREAVKCLESGLFLGE